MKLRRILIHIVCITLLLSEGVFTFGQITSAAIRETITYQAKIVKTSLVPPANGNYNFRFRIYDAVSGGNLLFTETFNGGNQLAIDNGVVTAELNSICADWVGACASNGGVDFSTNSLFVQMEWDADGAGGTFEEVFTPRRRLTAAPYAQMSAGLTTNVDINFVSGASRSMQWNEANDRTLTIENDNGSNVANLLVEGQVRTGQFSAAPTALGNGAFYYDTTSNQLFARVNGSWVDIGSGSTLSLDGAYNNGSTITVDTTDVIWDLTSTNDFILKDSGTAFFTFNDDKSLTYVTNQTSTNAITMTGNSLDSGDLMQLSATSLTSGDALQITTNGTLTGKAINVVSGGILVDAGGLLIDQDATTSLQVRKNGAGTTIFDVDTTNSRIGVGTSSPSAFIHAAPAAISGTPATTGSSFRMDGNTFTDNATAASGTATNMVFNSFAQPTLAATNTSVTTTNAYTTYVAGAPAKGTNDTATNAIALGIAAGAVGAQTNSYGLYVNTQTGATNNYAAVFAGGSVGIRNTAPSALLTLGTAGTTGGTMSLAGSTSGTVTIQTAAAAGTYTLTLPTDDGTSNQVLTTDGSGVLSWSSAGGGSTAWSSLTNPSGNLSLSMGTNTTTFNWATGTSTNNLFSFTTDASANGTGSLVNIQTGASATVLPLRVRAGSTEGLMVNASGDVGIGTTTPSADLHINRTGELIRMGDGSASDFYLRFNDGTNRDFGWDDNYSANHTGGTFSTFNQELAFRTLQSSNTPVTCSSTVAGMLWMDTDTGLLYVCDTSNSRNKWLGVMEQKFEGESNLLCGSGNDVGNDNDCYLDFGDNLGADGGLIGSYIPRSITVTGYSVSIDDDACTSGSFDVEIWDTGSGSSDNTYTLDTTVASGLTGETHNSSSLNLDITGPDHLVIGLDNNCGQGIDDFHIIIYYRELHT